MGAFKRFLDWMRGDDTQQYVIERSTGRSDAETRLDLKLLMIASAVGYLASGLAMCEWRTFRRDVEEWGDEYFRLNMAPNPNQNHYAFCLKLVGQLALENEALIFERNRQLYIADSWTLEPHGTGEDWYRNVTVDDDDGRSIDLPAREVLHLTASWFGLSGLLASVAEEYTDIIAATAEAFERQTNDKGVLTINALGSGSVDDQQRAVDIVQKQFKDYFSKKSAVLVMTKGYQYTPQGRATRNTSELSDLINLTDEWAERVALALRVPPAILKGNAENTEHARRELIAWGVRPLAGQIECEYNAKRIGRLGYTKGSRLLIDTATIEMADLTTMASTADKLISCGQYSINELRRKRKEPLLDEPAADSHYITKNYGVLGQEESSPQPQQIEAPQQEPPQTGGETENAEQNES